MLHFKPDSPPPTLPAVAGRPAVLHHVREPNSGMCGAVIMVAVWVWLLSTWTACSCRTWTRQKLDHAEAGQHSGRSGLI